MSKILITGGFGYVGGRLTKRLASDHEVLVSARLPATSYQLSMHGRVQAILHERVLNPDLFPKDIDCVIHLAALNEWDSVKYPSEAIRVNVDETRIILDNAIHVRAKQFIYFSTAHIYGSPLAGDIDELTVPRPVHPYAITHRAAEDYVTAAGLQGKLNAIVVRLSNAFGAPVTPSVNRWTLLVNDLCQQAAADGTLKLRSNGLQYRDFVCLTDVEETIARMVSGLHAFNQLIYNLGSGISIRVIDMANAIAAACVTVFQKNIPVLLPVGSEPTKEHTHQFSIARLFNEGCDMPNDVTMELERLLQFCKEYFPVSA